MYALLALSSLAAVGFGLWIYLRREPPVRGRLVLAALRVGALVLLILLLWNPVLPRGVGSGETTAPSILLDASLSMTAELPDGTRPWDEAVALARDRAGGNGRILLFGDGVRDIPVDSLDPVDPEETVSRLEPALERVASLGGSSVIVLSDSRLHDPVAVSSLLERTGIGVRFVDVGGRVRNVGLAEVDAPSSLAAGEEGTVGILLAGEGGQDGDSVTLELRGDERLLASRRIPFPAPGREVRHELGFTAPAEEGTHRLEARAVSPDDAFEHDDRRVHYLEVRDASAALVLLSLRPDWEPRYLLPVLEQVTGLDARGFLRLSGDRWLPVGSGGGPEGVVTEPEVREALEGSEVLALHGTGVGNAPAWLPEAAGAAPRLLVLPAGEGGASVAGVEVGAPLTGEWYAVPELPASPLAGELSGVDFDGLPPLTVLFPLADGGAPGPTAFRVRPGQDAEARPGLVLTRREEGRAAVALAAGFWRWAAREGAPREAYRRLWSGVAGWLLEEEATEGAPLVAPAERPAPRQTPVEWTVRGEVGDSVALRIDSAGTPVVDTTVARPGASIRTAVLPPGRYTYRARAGGLPGGEVTGALEVSDFSADLLRPRLDPPGAEDSGAEEGGPATAGPRRPLRTHPLPYLLILGLLCAEWIGRRRQGLR